MSNCLGGFAWFLIFSSFRSSNEYLIRSIQPLPCVPQNGHDRSSVADGLGIGGEAPVM